MSEEKKVQENAIINEDEMELDLDELNQVSGGSIGNARREKTEAIDSSVAERFSGK